MRLTFPTIRKILNAPTLSWRARVDLLAFALLRKVYLPVLWPVHLGRGTVWLSRDTWPTDRLALYEILLTEVYLTEYRGATVIDAGAHKGYYGAYALQRGAKAVLSYEPAADNYTYLARTAALFRQRGSNWQTYKAAVGGHSGSATLYVAHSSWGHSLIPQSTSTRGEETVPVVAMAEVLEGASRLGGRTIVKLDIEGSEREAVLCTDLDLWRHVQEVFVEIHPRAHGTDLDLVDYLRRAGFSAPRRCGTPNLVYHLAQHPLPQ